GENHLVSTHLLGKLRQAAVPVTVVNLVYRGVVVHNERHQGTAVGFLHHDAHGAIGNTGVVELGEGVIAGGKGAVLHGRTVIAYVIDDGPVNLGTALIREGHGGIPVVGIVGRDGIGHIGANVHILGQASPEAGKVHTLPLLQGIGGDTHSLAQRLVGIVG